MKLSAHHNSRLWYNGRCMNEEEHKVDELESKLYSRTNNVQAQYKKHRLQAREWETPRAWSPDNQPESMAPRKPNNPFVKFLTGALVFFAACILIAIYLFSKGTSNVSPDNINLVIGGPIQIGGGQELALDVGVENKNTVPLQLVDVVVDYPDGTKSSSDTRTDLKRERFNLGDIKSGGVGRKIFKSVLFGEEGTSKNIKVGIEYRVPGSNSIFKKEKDFALNLSSSPVAIVTKGINEITSGQAATFEVTVTSNSEKPLKNIVLRADYPFGYSFNESAPVASDSNNVWKLGTLSPKETRVIKIQGTLEGQNNEDRYFKFTVGNADSANPSEVGTVLALASQAVSIQKPFIGLDLAINNSEDDVKAVGDDSRVSASIKWVNNTPNKISNAEVSALLTGLAFDKTSVSPSQGGFFDSTNNTITWTKRGSVGLAQLEPGDSGLLGFTFKTKSSSDESQVKISVSAKGQRVAESNTEQEIHSTVSKIAKITTGLHLASSILYYSGPFENSGEAPPKVEHPTTYTVVWTVTNTLNSVSNAKVRATLPLYVAWNNLKSPTSEKISFDPVSGSVIWDLGNVSSQTGFTKPKREVAFQITFKPSASQVGISPELVKDQVITGVDSFANIAVSDSRSDLTTLLVNDPEGSENDSKVQP